MEKQFKIPTFDKKKIYGTLRGSLENPLLIFVHGFTGYKDEHIFFNGARYFEKKGISTFRFNLYHWENDSRKMEDCTLSLHAMDLDTVIDYFRKKGVKKIFVTGHSFGGLSVLLSKKQDFDAALLWDASINPSETTKSKYIKELDKYYTNLFNAYGFTIGKQMVDENNKLKPFNLIKQFIKPIKIIVTGKGELINGGKKYFQLANKPKDFAIVPNATHCFDEEGTEDKLFQETLKWVNKFK